MMSLFYGTDTACMRTFYLARCGYLHLFKINYPAKTFENGINLNFAYPIMDMSIIYWLDTMNFKVG